MSLEIGWLNERTGEDMYNDVEVLFNQVIVTDTPEVRKVLKLIEKAEYNNQFTFVDRFGVTLYLSCLSTGCKAALSVLLGEWDRWVSLIEVGTDATSVIVSMCRHNKVLLRDYITDFVSYEEPIDVVCDGIKFTSVEELALYISESGR